MKISQEAREAAAEWAFLFFAGQAKSEFEAAMQSLINSTLERAASIADNHADMNAGSNDEYVNGIECGCMSVAAAIRQLIEE